MKNYDQSLLYFERAIELDSNDSDLFNNKALIFDFTNKHDEAIQFFDKALMLNSNLIHTLNNKGILLNKLRRYNEAIDCFDKALAIDSTFAEFYNNKGLSLYSLNKINESLLCFNKAIDIDSTKSNRDYEQQRNKNYRDRDYNLDDKTTPTPHRSYHEKISKNNRYDQDNKKKGVYASTNKCEQL